MRRAVKSQSGMTVLETIVVIGIIGLLFGIATVKFQKVAREAEKTAVKVELANIRGSLRLYRMLNNRNAASLRELMETSYLLPARTGRDPYSRTFISNQYLVPHAVNERGEIVDSFGNPFQYDPVRGEVRSTTEGYETW